ncbi:kinase suppressor of Ras 1-like isoform X3 [Antennarius striatus]|uniref:kinase suppressor of Ras 1-like isoform X3 n=1 Tax=Antennarius striatus TaxID=241820 RepID=UPI0035B084D3
MAGAGEPAAVRLQTSEPQDTMRRLVLTSEDASGVSSALSCLKSASESETSDPFCPGPHLDGGAVSLVSPAPDPSSPSAPMPPPSVHGRSISLSVMPCSRDQIPQMSTEEMSDTFALELSIASRTRPLKPSQTHPLPSNKLLQLLPNILLTRGKSQEPPLSHRLEDPAAHKACRKNRGSNAVNINGCGRSCDDSALASPGPVPVSAPYTMTANPPLLNNLLMYGRSPQTQRRDIGLEVTHRFSTKSWLSQVCQVCSKGMMFGVKCKHCKLKCHNKCTRDAPSCRISFLTLPAMRRAESVPSDINNRIDHTAKIPLQFRTLPKATARKQEPAPNLTQVDSSSNPSSATSSTASSPAHSHLSNPPLDSSTPPSDPAQQDAHHRFHFPDVTASSHPPLQSSVSCDDSGIPQEAETPSTASGQEGGRTSCQEEVEEVEEECPAEDEEAGHQCDRKSTEECDEDGLEDLPESVHRRGAISRWKGPIWRKASQTSMYLQEWDIPYEQLQLEELIGKGRWGRVHRGRWHGEVAIRLLEIDGNNQDHLKLFKKEVMNYRQTRHENVVLFMGACMAPPHLAIITSFCKGLTLYSFVRERGHMLDVNKTRQIALEIVNGMGYLHAKDIIHKDLKSKNVFYDTNKVVITDFGLFGISGVVQEGRRRKNELRIPQGWLYYLSSEIVRRMSPEVDEDQLPFSKAADVYAFGTIWYELQVGGWPLPNQPVEAKIWLIGSGEGIKKELLDANLGKEVMEVLSACWALEADDRPTFSQVAGLLERLPKLNRRLSHPGHWKSPEYVS